MDLGLAGKVAIVTGGSRGLGLAAAHALVAEGASAVVCARGEEALKSAAAALQKSAALGGRVAHVVGDVSTEAGARTVVDGALAAFGAIDVVVNNVGLAKGGDLDTTSDAEWQEAFDQTLFPAIRVSRLAVPHIRIVC